MKTAIIYTALLFLFTACEKDPLIPQPGLPQAGVTNPATNITSTAAKTGGSIIASGGAPVTSRGICWSSTTAPTINNNKTEIPGGLGSFTIDITGLNPGTVYYARVFVTNEIGTSYGNQVSFTTLSIPVVSTNGVTSITTNSATCGGNVSGSGGSTVTARGICWSTAMNPTTSLSTKTINGSGTGTFTNSMTGLLSNTTYYVRAYATNAIGTAYGANSSFKTN